MKTILGRKVSFNKFLVAVFAIFLLVIFFNTIKFFWDNRNVSQQNISLLTQNVFSSEGTGNMQIFARDLENKNIVEADVKIDLLNSEAKKLEELYKGKLTEGQLAVNFLLPKLDVGSYQLRIAIKSGAGKDELIKNIEIKSEPRVIISTDRPLYKPGQQLSFRVLTLDKGNLQPFKNKEVLVSISNPKGDKLFQQRYTTSDYGIVSGEFGFSDELAFGEYKIEAAINGKTAEKIVEVKYFDLPKFEVQITESNVDKSQGKISGKILARYFFGKPLKNADAYVTAGSNSNIFADIRGKTDENGFFEFNFDGITSLGLYQNISIVVEINDGNNKIVASKTEETKDESIVVELIPESGKLKPGLDNEILFISSRADGAPVKTTAYMTGGRLSEFATNEFGIAKFSYKPRENSSVANFTLNVQDEHGNTLLKTFNLQNDANSNGYIILRTEKAVYENENKVKLEVSATNNNPTQIDIIQDGQVKASESIELKDGRAEKEITLPDQVFGTVEVRATQTHKNNTRYRGEVSFVSDSKIILVDRPKDLSVNVVMDKNTYLPGSEAKITFNVNDENGKKENAAIGLKIVDEALLSLQDDGGNLSKLLFLVDEKIQESAREINGLTWEQALNNKGLATRDDILQAMFLNVPLDGLSISQTEKDNTKAWYSYKNGKSVILGKFFMLIIALLFILIIRFWWQITSYGAEKKTNITIWGSSLIVAILSAFTGTVFFSLSSCGYSGNYYKGYCSFWDKLGNLLEYLAEDILELLAKSPYFFYGVLILFAGAVYLAWTYRYTVIEKYKKLAVSFFAIFIIYVFFSLLERFNFGISEIMDDGLWFFVSSVCLATLIIGTFYFLIIKNFEKTSYSVSIWSLVFLIGLSSMLFFPAMIVVYILILAFGLIRFSNKERTGIEDEILNLEKQFLTEGKTKEAAQLEMLILRRELERRDVLHRVGAALVKVVGILIIAFIIFMIFAVSFASRMMYHSTGGYEDDFFEPPMMNRPSGGGGGDDDLLWGGTEANVEGAISLGSTEPPTIIKFFEGVGQKADKVESRVEERQIVVGQEGKVADQAENEFKKASRVRKFFPETMYWNAELIAENGKAEITIPVKDSITSWRLSALANSQSGKVGSKDVNMVTFQDFFIDFDLPSNLTKGDELTLPISVFNYLEDSQNVRLAVKEDSWFTLLTPNNKVINLASGEMKFDEIKIRLEKFGDFVLRIDGQGTKMADAVEKIVKVLPFGQRITQTVASEELNQNKVEFQALFGEQVIKGTQKVTVKIYPSVLSQIVEGLDNILRFPSGCFEQTSSSLYPNILVLKYLNRIGKDSPAIKEKAEDFIAKGVQKLLTYEIEPGGFSYFGGQPAETILSAYGLMEFNEMKGVVFVDENLIKRTKDFLYKRQNGDGSFNMVGSHSGGFSGGDEIAKNAYVIWALSEADAKDSRLKKSIDYLQNHINELENSPYSLALATNAFINYDQTAKYAIEAIDKLKTKIKKGENNEMYYELDKPNHYGSYGYAGNMEVNSLAAIAFSRFGETEYAKKLVDHITKGKDGYSTWGSTQATILALKALVENEIAGQKVKNNEGKIKITFNNEKRELTINPDNSEVYQYLEFKEGITGQNFITIEKDGKISATLQITKDYYREWNDMENKNVVGGFSISSEFNSSGYDPVKGDVNFITGTDYYLHVKLYSSPVANLKNVVAEVPIPAGFEVVSESLRCSLKNIDRSGSNCYRYNRADISRFEIKGDRVILYFDVLNSNLSPFFSIQMRPKYSGKFKVLPARMYSYYDPGSEAFSSPIGEIFVSPPGNTAPLIESPEEKPIE